MIIASISGGLGNQMFQYAMARRLANHHNVELKLDLGAFQTGSDTRPEYIREHRRRVEIFNLAIIAQEASAAEIAQLKDPYSNRATISRIVRRLRRIKPRWLWPATHLRERQYQFEPAALSFGRDAYLEGFWQSERYFADAAAIIRKELLPKDPAVLSYARQYVEKLRSFGGPIVSLHVRRGDLAQAHEKLAEMKDNPDPHLTAYVAFWGPSTPLEYIYSAIARFEPSARFVVFSDTPKDVAWCRQNIQSDRLHFSEGHNAVQDMAIMTACDHHIVAPSTFSWWAAWLDDRSQARIIAPRKWMNDPTGTAFVDQYLLLPKWEII